MTDLGATLKDLRTYERELRNEAARWKRSSNFYMDKCDRLQKRLNRGRVYGIRKQLVDEVGQAVIYNNILNAVCRLYNLDAEQVMSKCRKHKFVMGRMLIRYCMCQKGMSLVDVGKHTKTDHTTALYARNLIQDYIDTNQLTPAELNLINELKK